MKFSCINKKIKKRVAVLERMVFKTHTIMSLTGIEINVMENQVIFSGTNLSAGLIITVPARSEQTGVCVVPAGLFSQVIGSIPDESQLTMELIDNQLVITTTDSRISLHTFESADYPQIPKTTGEEFIFNCELLVQGLKSVSFAALVSDIKPELSSVYWYQDSYHSIFVATDAFRLAEKKIPYTKVIQHPGALIPLKNIPDLVKLLSDSTGDIVCSITQSQLSITHKDFFYTTRLTTGNYPAYGQIIPKTFTTTVTIDKDSLISVLRALGIFQDRFHQINLITNYENQTIQLSINHNEKGEFTTTINGTVTGTTNHEIVINQKNINDVVGVITESEIEIHINESNKPIMIRGKDNLDFLYIMMPVNRL